MLVNMFLHEIIVRNEQVLPRCRIMLVYLMTTVQFILEINYVILFLFGIFKQLNNINILYYIKIDICLTIQFISRVFFKYLQTHINFSCN